MSAANRMHANFANGCQAGQPLYLFILKENELNTLSPYKQPGSTITNLVMLAAVIAMTACSPKPSTEESAAQTKVIVDQAVAEAKKEMLAEQAEEKARQDAIIAAQAEEKARQDAAVAAAKKEMIAEQKKAAAKAKLNNPPPAQTAVSPAATIATPSAPIPETAAKIEPAAKIVCANCGVVLSVREVETEGQGSGLGVVAGGVAGGLLGNQVGQGTGRDLATIAGVVGGAVAGNKIEKVVKKTKNYDITVKMETGEERVVQQATVPNVTIGDAVKIENGAIVRR